MYDHDLIGKEGTDAPPTIAHARAGSNASDYKLVGVDADGDAHYYSDMTGSVRVLADAGDGDDVCYEHVGDLGQLERWLAYVASERGWAWLETDEWPVGDLSVGAIALAEGSR